MLGGADNPNGELLSYIIGADTGSGEKQVFPASGVSAIKTGGMEVVVTRQEYGIIAAGV
ncbi:hypothetical protein PM308_26995 [Escherichia coli]|uniref:hypothetical protein n=1 Tax=Escherichia coli TaxID=562 RepID=UPI0012DE6D09|nr:hypothetical protein [Escherichia coli]MDB7144192.1 hypothetical protein [Escherichia coli]MDB7159325.1 hypothetical protein [Escherichia coli]MDB7164438.1 hypothetical protein [Escherichia coli]MDB7174689.1 hypothetical protein [Escherichia coli]MDB7184563.1 hypothetical protein [Escherichia coli]